MLELFGLARWQGKPLKPSKPAALLVYLAYRQNWVRREELSLLFYPEASEYSNLRQLLRRAKQLLPDYVDINPEQVRCRVKTDVQQFREAIASADWPGVLRSYQPLLLGFEQNEVGFDTWLDLERSVLHESYLNALYKYCDELEAQGDYQQILKTLESAASEDLQLEEVCQRRMQALAALGRREEALQVFAVLEQQLKHDLNLSPLPETLELAQAIYQGKYQQGQSKAGKVRQQPLKPPLIGRDEVLKTLDTDTRLIFLAGEAGIGKSFLLQYCAPTAACLQGQEGLAGVPYYPLLGLLKHLDHTRLAPIHQEVLAHFDPEVFAGVPAPLEALTARSRILRAWLALLQTCLQDPVLIIDDLQWFDAASLEFVIFLGHQSSFRLLIAYRPNELGPDHQTLLNSLQNISTTIHLEPLSASATQTLLAQLSGQNPGPEQFASWLHRHSGGNPLFILETLHWLKDQGLLSTEGNWHSQLDHLSLSYNQLRVPQRIQELVLRRWTKLHPNSQRILHLLSVEPTLRLEHLAHISKLALWDVTEALSQAEHHGFLEGQAFRHDVIRQSLYQHLSPSQRQVLHQHIAQQTPEALAAAWHYEKAEQWHESLEAIRKAMWGYIQKSLYEEAYRIGSKALGRLRAQVDTTLLAAELAFCQFHLGQIGGAQDQAIQLSHSPNHNAQALAMVVLAYIAIEAGDFSQAQQWQERASRLSSLEPHISNYANWLKYPIYHALGRSSEIIPEVEADLGWLQQSDQQADYLLFSANLGSLYFQVGRTQDAFDTVLDAIHEAQRLGAGYYQQLAALNLADPAMSLKKHDIAIQEIENALAAGNYVISNKLKTNLSILYEITGNRAKAFELASAILQEEHSPWVRQVLLMLQVRCSSGAMQQEVLRQLSDAVQQQSPATEEALELLRQHSVQS